VKKSGADDTAIKGKSGLRNEKLSLP